MIVVVVFVFVVVVVVVEVVAGMVDVDNVDSIF